MSENTTTTAKPDVTKSATYKSAVTAGRRAVATQGKANWTLGDLAVTIETAYGDNTIGRFADDIEIARGTLYDLRSVARAYADGDRSANSWTVHQVFQTQDDRVDLVSSKTWTVADARALVKSRKDGDAPADDTNGTDDTDDNGTPADDFDTRYAKAVAEVQRLEGELLKARALVAKLDTERPAPVPETHRIKGIPAHTADQHVTACPKCTVQEIAPARARRASRRAA